MDQHSRTARRTSIRSTRPRPGPAPTPSPPGRPRPERPTGPLAALVLALPLALLLAACGGGSKGPGVAGLASTGSSASTGTGSGTGGSGDSGAGGSDVAGAGGVSQTGLLAYSRCMRAHGISDFPDPSGGGLQLRATAGSDLDPNNPRFQAAQKACESLRPTPNPAQRQAMQAQLLKFSRCMRAHGITDFPDPSGGGLQIRSTPGSDLNPNDPRFQAAQQACQKLMPGPGGESGSGKAA